ncbi:MAG: hypothetical protein ACYCUI_09630 [Vulcanimicrobiaceae bacterium]|jgi:hypothetical protein
MAYQTTMVQFGEWVPDDDRNIQPGSPLFWVNGSEVALQDAKNVLYTSKAYRPFLPPVAQGIVLPVTPVDADTYTYNGTNYLIAGSGAALYYSTNGGTTWTLAGSGYTGAQWSFTQYGNCVYASNGTDAIQTMDLSAGTPSFTALAPSTAPKAYVLGVIRDFVMAGNITAGDQTGAFVVQWSGLAAPATWDIPNTQQSRADQSGAQTLYAQYGQIQFIAQGEEQGLIFQDRGITRVQYQGGDVVFGFYTYERKRGLLTRRAAAQLGNTVFYLSADGFYSTDGSQVNPIGYGKINRWFFSDCSDTTQVRAAVDTVSECVVWHYPNHSGGWSQLAFNWYESRWTHGNYAAAFIYQGMNGTAYQAQLFDSSNKVNTLSGSPTDCEVTTNYFRFDPAHRALCISMRILSDDANTATGAVSAKVSDQDADSWSGYGAPETISRQISVRADGYMHAVNVKMTNTFTYAQGVGLTFTIRGRK